MLKFAQFIVIFGFLGLALPAPAADDDLTSSAYLVFDPETGEFVTVQDPDRTKQNHAARDPANVASNQVTASADTAGEMSPLGAAVVVAVALLGAAVWFQLKKRRAS